MVEKALAAMALVFLSGSALAQSSTSMSRSDHAAIKAACTDLVLDYAYYRDRPDALGFANVFAPEGELRVMGQVFIGRKALHDRLANATDGPVYRHMMSTIRIFPVSPREATGGGRGARASESSGTSFSRRPPGPRACLPGRGPGGWLPRPDVLRGGGDAGLRKLEPTSSRGSLAS